jgi:pimeloyl-ACP methyl ester carboxylesterase
MDLVGIEAIAAGGALEVFEVTRPGFSHQPQWWQALVFLSDAGGEAMTQPVIGLPGGVMPAALRYAPLKAALGNDTELHTKDLEVYARDEPAPDYSIDVEIAALAKFADALGAERFHLVGYSGGGFVSLAFAGVHPDRLLSLAVFEPARIPGDLSPEEAVLDKELRRALGGAGAADFMRIFTTMQVRPGVELPPPSGPPPPWMGKRPAGLAAMMREFSGYRFDRNRLRRLDVPVFYGYGDQTAEMVERQAAILGGLLPDIRIRRFAGVHHFLPPERIYTGEHVESLRELWTRAEARTPSPTAEEGVPVRR